MSLGTFHSAVWSSLGIRWSPLLLVGLGAFRLAEWAADRRRLRHARAASLLFQPTRLGPGYGLLAAAFLALSVGGAVLSRHHRDRFSEHLLLEQGQNWNQLFGDRHESRDTLSYSCAPGSSVSIDLGHGDLTIAGTSPDSQIHVSTHTTIFSSSDADAAEKARSVQPTFRTEGDHITLSGPASQQAELDLDVTLPAATTLTVNTDHGDLAVSHLKAAATLTANHGDVTLSDIQGPVTARLNNSSSSLAAHQVTGPTSISGRLEDVTLSDAKESVTIEGDIFGDLHLERLAGPLHLRTSRIDLEAASLAGTLQAEGSGDLAADQISGPVVINTRNRNINLEAVRGPLTVNNQNGSVSATLLQPVSPVDIINRHGQVSLELPATSAFTIDAETTDADLTNDFGLQPATSDSRSTLQGSVGSGGASIHIRTTQGDISVEKADRAPAAPVVPEPPSPPQHPKPEASSSGEVTF